MDMNYYKQYEPIFGAWHITRLIGEGSFGKVFEMERTDISGTYRAALKAITVPVSETELRSVIAENRGEAGARAYYDSFVRELMDEFSLMSRLKGNSNIVSYENHQVIEHTDGIGWDILIQMELLTPLNDYINSRVISRQDVIKLGIDMCKALELCQKYNIIHRDVKPENIFISDAGDFKLGDFGIARTVEKTTSSLSKKGTYTYMAPEVYKSETYGSTVDIYSLGIVLYRLLNEGRTPFMPPYPAIIRPEDRDTALSKRLFGAPMPPPAHADGRLAEIVLRACAYDPKSRYSVPLRMRQDLEAILYNREEQPYIYPEGDEVPLNSVHYAQTGDQPVVQAPELTDKDNADAFIPGSGTGLAAAGGGDGTQCDFAHRSHSGGSSRMEVHSDRTQRNFPYLSSGEENRAELPPKEVQAPEKSKKGGKGVLIAAVAVVLVAAVAGGGLFLSERKKAEVAAHEAAAAVEAAQQLKTAQDEAYGLYQQRQFTQCVEYAAGQLQEAHPGDQTLTAILASAQFELGDYEGSAQLYQELSAQEDYEMKVESLRDYAVCLARLGRLDEAATIFVMLTDLGASADVTGYVLGETYYAKQDYEDAAEEFRNVLAATEDGTLRRRCYTSLGETYRESGDYHASIQLLEEAVTQPEMAMDPVLYEMLGLAYYQSAQATNSAGDEAQAAQTFEQAIRLGVRKEYMYINAAFCHFNTGAQERALSLLDEMEQVYPRSCQPHALRALFYIIQEGEKPEEQRDYAAAQAEFALAQELVTGADNRSYLIMVETYIQELGQKGWL